MENQQLTNNIYEDLILECISDGVMTIDTNKKIKYINKAMCDILGMKKEDVIKNEMTCDQIACCSITEECLLHKALMNKEKVSNYEMVIKNTSGKHVAVSANTDFLFNENNELLGIVEVFRDISRIKELEEKLEDQYNFKNIIGKSKKMMDLFSLIPAVANSKSTVLLEGDSGTGKELIAHAIHINGVRRDKPFVAVNCAALSEGILESELFGHVKGAFTGAYYDKIGRFELADKGTIFLDEIGDISLNLQSKLLRVLQEEEFERVGSSKTIKVDTRIIAATNKDLLGCVKKGLFREDLYYRVRVFPIRIPPLKERKEDISLLIKHYIAKFNREMGKSINNISPNAIDVLLKYDYPGNVRELENIVEHAFVCASGNTILIEHLPKDIFQAGRDVIEKIVEKKETLEALEKEMIERILSQTKWSYKETCDILGISRTTLWRKMNKFGIQKH